MLYRWELFGRQPDWFRLWDLVCFLEDHCLTGASCGLTKRIHYFLLVTAVTNHSEYIIWCGHHNLSEDDPTLQNRALRWREINWSPPQDSKIQTNSFDFKACGLYILLSSNNGLCYSATEMKQEFYAGNVNSLWKVVPDKGASSQKCGEHVWDSRAWIRSLLMWWNRRWES